MNNSFIASLNNNVSEAPSGVRSDPPTGDLVDLNQVLQTTFTIVKPRLASLQTIIRCDALPVVEGSIQTFHLLFRNMIDMIINYPPVSSKLFIYIKCERSDQEVIDLTLPAGYGRYEISFHTNINNRGDWEKANYDKLAECRFLSETCIGSFTSHSISNTGCLFTLKVPGKLN